MPCACSGGGGGEAAQSQRLYQSLSSVLCWDMVNAVLRVWLQMVDTGGKQKEAADWDLQEASIKILRCAPATLSALYRTFFSRSVWTMTYENNR